MDLDRLHVVLVALDLSPASDEAFRTALKLASSRYPCHLHLVHVLSGELNAAFASDRLGEWASRFPDTERAGIDCRFHTLRGDAPAPEIVRFAAKIDADLVVVGTAGRHGLSRWVLGSVAEEIVRSAGCPVLVARDKAHEAVAPG